MIKSQLKIVLASTSPQRIKILSDAGYDFEVIAPNYLEVDPPNTSVEDIAKLHAFKKAESLLKECPKSLVIGCDTLVSVDGTIIGKPTCRQDAKRILQLQQSKTLQVISGVAVCNTATHENIVRSVTTELTFASMTESEIENYLDSNEWQDKSGAFSIQGLGAKFITNLNGDFYNVVGLPIRQLYTILQNNEV